MPRWWLRGVVCALVATVQIGATPLPATSRARSATDRAPADSGSLDPPDPYFPTLGNRGYEVEHYDIGLRYTPRSAGGSGELRGDTTVHATATEPLERLSLDLAGFDVERVHVDGLPAPFQRIKSDLEIRPHTPVAQGASFTVRVRYSGVPTHGKTPGLGAQTGLIASHDGAVTFNQPDGASHWFPANDHPTDKATFAFRINVPKPLVAVANGTLRRTIVRGERAIWVWEEVAPMTTYLSQLAIGDFELRDEKPVDGVAIRNAYAPKAAKRAARAAADTPAMLRFLSAWFGRYPFAVYGIMVPAAAPRALAFEAQTFSLIAPDLFDDKTVASAILAHELAHQWFGDSVSPATWEETWLNEGFATYAEWLWSDHALDDPIEREVRLATKAVRRAPDVAADAPGRDEMFGSSPYERGGLTLHALRLEVGDAVFAAIVRTYVERFAGRSATTEDFVSVADEVSGRGLGQFLRSWLGPGPLPRLPRTTAPVGSDPPPG